MNSKVRDLVFMALYAALFAVLDIISNEFIPFLQMPQLRARDDAAVKEISVQSEPYPSVG